MALRRMLSTNRVLELLPLFLVPSVLPFLHGGESLLSRVFFLGFPVFYLPILMRRKRSVPSSFLPLFWAWIAFLSAALVSTLFSINRSLSLPSLFELIGVFLYFVFFSMIIKRRDDLRLFAYSIIFVGLILSFISLFLILSPPETIPGMNLVYATFGHNHLSDYLLFALPFSVMLFLRQKKPFRSFVAGALVVFFFLSFFLTFARTAFLVLSLIVFGIVWIYRPTQKKALFLSALASIPIIMLLVILVVSNFQIGARLDSQTFPRSAWLLRQIKKPVVDARLNYWQQALSGFRAHPFVGNGPGTFRLISQRFRQQPNVFSWFAHSYLLQTATEMGVLGLTSLMVLLILVFKTVKPLDSRGHANYSIALFLCLLGVLLQSFFDFNFDFLAIFLLFWVSVAFLLRTSGAVRMVPSPRALLKLPTVFACISLVMIVTTLLSRFLLSQDKNSEYFSNGKSRISSRVSLLLPSLDHERFDALLRTSSDAQHNLNDPAFENALLFWAREDPNIYIWLANLTDSSPKAYDYYVHALGFSSAYDRLHLMNRFLQFEEADEHFVVETFFSILTQSGFSHLKDRLQEVSLSHRHILFGYIKQHYSPDISDFPQMRWWASKVFYFTGFELLDSGDSRAVSEYWDLARLISPDWDYFQIEASALRSSVLHDASGAQSILLECLNNAFARESCLNQLRSPLSFLPEPGSYRDRIAAIPYR